MRKGQIVHIERFKGNRYHFTPEVSQDGVVYQVRGSRRRLKRWIGKGRRRNGWKTPFIGRHTWRMRRAEEGLI